MAMRNAAQSAPTEDRLVLRSSSTPGITDVLPSLELLSDGLVRKLNVPDNTRKIHKAAKKIDGSDWMKQYVYQYKFDNSMDFKNDTFFTSSCCGMEGKYTQIVRKIEKSAVSELDWNR